MPRSRKKPARRTAELVVLSRDNNGQGSTDRRVALPARDRHLSFGDRWNYAPAPEASDYIKIQPRYPLFINGKFVTPRSGKYFDSINPATEDKITEIADANAQDVDLAVKSARR